jgi:metal-responsive CopG/Arc/MetJ family transcriptional regulator
MLLDKTMKQKIALTLDQDIVEFLDNQAQGNRSEFLNNLLRQYRSAKREAQMIVALQDDISDPEYLEEIQAWDKLAGEGLNAEG